MSLNSISIEKQKILDCQENTLVIANPGTGKTFLLSHKYISLLKQGLKPEDILCLTFTEKAREEMENRIKKFIDKDNIPVSISNLKIHTFHSFSAENIIKNKFLVTNLGRYFAYKYLKEKEVFNYSDGYLMSTIAPTIDKMIQYLKNHKITPEKIDIKRAGDFLQEKGRYKKEDLEKILYFFVELYKEYEKIKQEKGYLDYVDLLLNFKIDSPLYKYVLVDELQDANLLEAEIALHAGQKFFAVGDKKQAIFGFQGGSVTNFNKFKQSKVFVLSENFRSTNEILNYAKEFYKLNGNMVPQELENLRNVEGKTGQKPKLCVSTNQVKTTLLLVKQILNQKKVPTILARTNQQLLQIASELKKQKLNYLITFSREANFAKKEILTFLRSIFSENTICLKKALFTPFISISTKDAFEISENKKIISDEIYKKVPELKKIKESMHSFSDLINLFDNLIIPKAREQSKEYLNMAENFKEMLSEAKRAVDAFNPNEIILYLSTADIPLSEIKGEQNTIILSTVHKAKGREFDYVIYLPAKSQEKLAFRSAIIDAILASQNNDKSNVDEELNLDFVAITRAKNELYILNQNYGRYINSFIDKSFIPEQDTFIENKNNFEKNWFAEKIIEHFSNKKSFSFSEIYLSPEDYLYLNILKIGEISSSQEIGINVHSIASKILKGLTQEEIFKQDSQLEKYEKYIFNIYKIISEIKQKYALVYNSELSIDVPLSEFFETDAKINFNGRIDAVFKDNNENYLIVDWKTDRNEVQSSKHRQQLELYMRALSKKNNIPIEKIKIAIAYVGLKKQISDGVLDYKLDEQQPSKYIFENIVVNKINLFLYWKENPQNFIASLFENESNDPILIRILQNRDKL
ncbi:MAG: hypothetical protein COZ66_01625 [Candidatus Huberarchaeum crystalense]|uniref:DNA 3'-5' helicase n=1 Tax=Huberarchaeum crystalense TaxID=2014257 RepID=A0A2H9RDN6_HUBC1|nr:ATP-dependent helicase [archaeon]OIP20130.1 MAG: hypothetical protein AUJ91_02085 [archaeon CG2_30_31_98]PIV13577.1 MAG: hypothetical protein COS45_02155 [Candidatus Huberarchaeum crystalense]PIV46516.1 MAG: hypothetical protein COS22_00945 [Candidatus Huberarchaeum crystalense]PIX28045.1 MAG: hypothetical protein COZ66_01625 [Candidatus Huberarchaeum crystalense]